MKHLDKHREAYHFGAIFFASLLMTFTLLFNACSDDDEPKAQTEVLSVDEYFPNSGKGGTLVTLKGKGFNTNLEGNTVEFSGVKAEVFSAKSDELVVLAPENGQTGTIRVSNGNNSVEVGAYTYQSLSVQRISPSNGPVGTSVRISGEGFSSLDSPAKVTINDKEALVVNVSDTLIVAKVPEAAGKGPVKVFVDGQEATGQTFIYQEIHSIKPLTGGKGTRITITGEGFDTTKENNVVYFYEKQGKVLEAFEDKLVVEAPEGVETNKISVTINEQKTVGPTFTVVPPPSINAIAPLSGPVGSVITIKGLTFSPVADENKVFINGKEIPVESSSETELVLKYPANVGSGVVEVVVNDQKTAGPQFTNQALGIIRVSPESGLAGTIVTIEGTGFSEIPEKNKVTFNGVEAEITEVKDNSIVVVAPENLSTGTLKIEVDAMQATAPQEFRRAGIMTITELGSTMTSTSSIIRVDDNNNIYISVSSSIYKISQEGNISQIHAGTNMIRGMDIYNNEIYFTETIYPGTSIKKLSADGTITEVRYSSTNFSTLSIDPHGNFYGYPNTTNILKITPEGRVETIFTNINSNDFKMAIDAEETIYFSYTNSQGMIKKKRVNTTQSEIWLGNIGKSGYEDGPVSTAKIGKNLKRCEFNDDGNLIIFDPSNLAIREVNMASERVSTLVKISGNGYVDGDLESAKWGNLIADFAIDKDNNIYLLDLTNKAIRKIILK